MPVRVTKSQDLTWFEVYQCPSWMIWKSVLREHEVKMTYFGWDIFEFLNIFSS